MLREILLKSHLKLNYEVKYTSKVRILLRVKDGIIKISAPPYTTFKKIESVILKNEDFVLKRLDEERNEEKVIHILGRAYKPVFLEGMKNYLEIKDDKVYLCLKNPSFENYQKLLRKYYLSLIKEKVLALIPDLKNDYQDLIIPEIKFKYMTSCFGNYHKDKHLINLSTMLMKYDERYLKCVLYHEMSHIYEMNHGKKFYQVFELKYPHAREIQHELKQIKYQDIL